MSGSSRRASISSSIGVTSTARTSCSMRRATLRSDVSRPFDKPETGRIAVKVINHLGDEVMKVFRVA